MKYALATLLVAVPFAVTAEEVQGLSRENLPAYRALLNAEVFYMIPDEGRKFGDRKEVVTLKQLLASSEGDAAFKALLREANIAGKLYALCGLLYSDHSAFLLSVDAFTAAADTVLCEDGPRRYRRPVHELVLSSSQTAVRLNSPSQSLVEWICSRGPEIMETYELDILGGDYPACFKDSWYPP